MRVCARLGLLLGKQGANEIIFLEGAMCGMYFAHTRNDIVILRKQISLNTHNNL